VSLIVSSIVGGLACVMALSSPSAPHA